MNNKIYSSTSNLTKESKTNMHGLLYFLDESQIDIRNKIIAMPHQQQLNFYVDIEKLSDNFDDKNSSEISIVIESLLRIDGKDRKQFIDFSKKFTNNPTIASNDFKKACIIQALVNVKPTHRNGFYDFVLPFLKKSCTDEWTIADIINQASVISISERRGIENFINRILEKVFCQQKNRKYSDKFKRIISTNFILIELSIPIDKRKTFNKIMYFTFVNLENNKPPFLNLEFIISLLLNISISERDTLLKICEEKKLSSNEMLRFMKIKYR